MDETLKLLSELGGVIGPVGVFLLIGGVLYLQIERTKRYHGENSDKLDTIAKTGAQTLDIVQQMNGRVIKLEEWRLLHDRHDNERFEQLRAALYRRHDP